MTTLTPTLTPTRQATLPDRFTLEIDWPDIRDGICGSTHLCPVARALSHWVFQQGIRVADISVNSSSAEIVLDWRLPSVRYMHTGQRWVLSYDTGRPVEPMTLSLVRLP